MSDLINLVIPKEVMNTNVDKLRIAMSVVFDELDSKISQKGHYELKSLEEACNDDHEADKAAELKEKLLRILTEK